MISRTPRHTAKYEYLRVLAERMHVNGRGGGKRSGVAFRLFDFVSVVRWQLVAGCHATSTHCHLDEFSLGQSAFRKQYAGRIVCPGLALRCLGPSAWRGEFRRNVELAVEGSQGLRNRVPAE